MEPRVYKRGERWVVRWAAERRFRSEEEARAAAKLATPPPRRDRRRGDPDPWLAHLLLRMREAGVSYGLLARALNELARVPAPTGGRWHGSTVRTAVLRAQAQRDRADAAARESELHVIEPDERLAS